MGSSIAIESSLWIYSHLPNFERCSILKSQITQRSSKKKIILFFAYLCMYSMHRCTCVDTWVSVWTYAWRGLKVMFSVFLHHSSLYIFKQGLLFKSRIYRWGCILVLELQIDSQLRMLLNEFWGSDLWPSGC